MSRREFSDFDQNCMRRAIQLARRAQGRVEPNPMVGCVLASRSRIIGEGYHRRFGGPHAEVHALCDAQERGHRVAGAIAYVTLEPCGHFGKTPPCTRALIDAGIRRVVAGVRDPGPNVAGRGFAQLRKSGVTVDVGCMAGEAKELIAPYVTLNDQHRPYVILKWAQSLDGKISTPKGESNAISGPEAHRWVHRLRARVDGVLVGIGTLMADDPRLTARDVPLRRTAARIVLDTRLRTPIGSKLVTSASSTPTVIVTAAKHASSRKARSLARKGVELLPCRSTRTGLHLPSVLRALGERQMTNLLVEGGAHVHASFLQQGLADEMHIFQAPRIISPLETSVVVDPKHRPILRSARRIGQDMLYTFRFDQR